MSISQGGYSKLGYSRFQVTGMIEGFFCVGKFLESIFQVA